MQYRCEATSLEGFIQQIAVSYVRHGYWYYVTEEIGECSDPERVCQKLIEKYGITWKKWKRAYRKQQGLSNLQLIRFGSFMVMMASDPYGQHVFFEREKGNQRDAQGKLINRIKDVRENAFRFGGYQIAHRAGHVQVRIDDETYRELKAYYVDLACRRKKESLIEEFYRFPFEPYAPIRRQAFDILRAVNKKRKKASYELVPNSCIWLKRRVVKPFEAIDGSRVAA